MTTKALVCLANGSEEIEAVTTIDLLVRAGIDVTTASVNQDSSLEIICSRGVRLLVNTTLVTVADDDFDVIILPGGVKGAEAFRDSSLLIEKVRQLQLDGKLVAAICAAPALVLEHHNLYPVAIMTGYPTMKDKIAERKWVDKRVCYDERVNLVTSQGPATAIDFALKIIERLEGKEKAEEVAAQLVLPPGIYNYRD